MAWAIVCCLVVGIAEPQIRQHSIVPTLLLFILTVYFWETVGKTLTHETVFFINKNDCKSYACLEIADNTWEGYVIVKFRSPLDCSKLEFIHVNNNNGEKAIHEITAFKCLSDQMECESEWKTIDERYIASIFSKNELSTFQKEIEDYLNKNKKR